MIIRSQDYGINFAPFSFASFISHEYIEYDFEIS